MKKILLFSIFILAVGLLVSLLIYLGSRGSGSEKPLSAAKEKQEQNVEIEGEKKEVMLFFPTYEGYLLPVKLQIEVKGNDREEAEEIVDALKNSPEGAKSPFPPGGGVRRIFISGNTAVVDLSLPEERTGAQEELLVIYSVVNSLIYNIAGVNEVKIVVEGMEKETLFGHVSLKYPFFIDMSYVAEGKTYRDI